MGLGDYIYLLTDSVKSYTPNLTSVYHHSISTISKVDNAVRPKLTGYLPDVENCAKIGQKVSEYLPDKESQAKIGEFAINFGKNAAVLGVQEGAKLVPGGYFIAKAIEKSLPDQKMDLAKTVNTLQARNSVLEKQAAGSGKSHTGAKILPSRY